MSTLLSYGFTTTSKPATQNEECTQSTGRPPNMVASSIFAPVPNITTLPTIPGPVPSSDTVLGKRTSRRPPVMQAEQAPSRSQTQRCLKSPPQALLSLASLTPPLRIPKGMVANALDSPIELTATLFSPRRDIAPIPRKPSQALQSSSRRVQEILKAKHVNAQAVPKSPETKGRYSSQSSISITPVSAYAGHDFRKPFPPLRMDVRPAPWDQEMALTPIEMDLGALEVIASLPETTRHLRQESAIKPTLRKNSVYHPGSRRSVLAVELPGGSIVTVITPEQSAWQRAPYFPGDIRLESKSRVERSPLTIIQESVDAELGLDNEKLAAERIILDELASFIESFGEGFQVHETGMDAFWLVKPAPRSSQTSHRALSLPLSVTSTLVQPLLATSVPSASVDSTSSRLVDMFDHLEEPELILDLPPTGFKRASYASSIFTGSSRTMISTPNSKETHSPPPIKHPLAAASSPKSQGHPSVVGTGSSPRKVRQVKGKGSSSSSGQKMSLRGLLRSAASIV